MGPRDANTALRHGGGPRWTASHLAFVALASAPMAHADDVPSATFSLVRLAGAEGCPDATTVRTEIEHRVGRVLFTDHGALAVEVALGPIAHAQAPGWHAQVFLRGADGGLVGVRELTTPSPDCSALAHAAALAVAVALDPDAVMRHSASPAPPAGLASDDPSASPLGSPSPAPFALPDSSSTPANSGAVAASAGPSQAPVGTVTLQRRRLPRRPAVHYFLGAYVGAAAGWFPSFAPTVGIVTTIAPARGPAWRVGSWYAPESRAESVAGGQIGMRLFAVSLAACPALVRSDRMTLSFCGGTTIGVETAAGLGFAWNATVDHVYWDVTAGADYRLILGPVYLSAAVDAGIPLIHSRWLVEGAGVAFDTPYANVRGSIGAGLSFR